MAGLFPTNPRLAREGLLWEVLLELPVGQGLPEGDPVLHVFPGRSEHQQDCSEIGRSD